MSIQLRISVPHLLPILSLVLLPLVARAQAPANDDCTQAIPLEVGFACNEEITKAGTTKDATGSNPSCGGINDVWYSFIATDSFQTITVDGADDADPVVALYSGDCAALTVVEFTCTDDEDPFATEVVEYWDFTPGQRYFIQVAQYDPLDGSANSGSGNFKICVVTTFPELSSITSFTPSGTTNARVEIAGTNFIGDLKVFFNGVQSPLIHSFDGVRIDAAVPAGARTGKITVETTHGLAESSSDFVYTPANPPSNDLCASAQRLLVNAENARAPVSATTIGTVPNARRFAADKCNAYDDDDVWFSFVATGSRHKIRVTPVAGFNPLIELYQGSCEALRLVDCIYDDQPTIDELQVNDLTPNTVYLIRVHDYWIGSGAGNFTISVSGDIPTDVTAPVATAFTPADKEVRVPAEAKLTIAFNEPVKAGTGAITLTVNGIAQTVASAAIAVNDKTVTITPAQPFPSGASVSVQIPAGTFVDLAGIPFAGIPAWTFTVLDFVAPTTASVIPANGATGVAVNTNVVLTLSEPIDKGTGNITLKQGTAVLDEIDVATAAVSVANNTATITLSRALPNSATISVTIPANAFKDKAGNPYAGSSWSFTTVAASDPAPTATVTPAGGATNVPPSALVTLNFSEAVNAHQGNIRFTFDNGRAAADVDVKGAAVVLSADKKTATIDLQPDFPFNATVTVAIGSGLFKDLAGNNYAGATWSFKTAPPAADTVKPTVAAAPNPTRETDGSAAITLSVVADDNVGVTAVHFRSRSLGEGGDFTAPAAAAAATAAKTYQYTLAVDKLGDKLGVEYEFIAKDAAGNEAKLSGTLRRTYPQGVAIPYKRFGSAVEQYELIGISLDMASARVSEVFEELGTMSKDKWRLVDYTGNPTTNSFSDLLPTSPLEVGKGYWMIVKDNPGKTITSSAGKAPAQLPFKVTLNASEGFQLVGNPYPFDIAWADILAANPGLDGKIKRFLVLRDGNYVDLKTDKSPLGRFRGAILDLGSGAGELVFPARFNQAIQSTLRVAAGKDNRTPVQEGWVTYLGLSSGDRYYHLGGFGMQPAAGAGLDAHDGLVPPQLGKPFHLAFATPAREGLRLTQDVVAPAAEHAWEMEAQAGGSTGPVTLSWQYLPSDPQGVWLFDRTNGQLIDMRAQSSYTYQAGDAEAVAAGRVFKIYYGSKERLAEALGLRAARLLEIYPNPFRYQTRIPFVLPQTVNRTRVEAAIYSASGGPVVTLARGEYPAGLHWLDWDGSDAGGKRVPPGMYVCRFTVGTAGNGTTITRKIVVR